MDSLLQLSSTEIHVWLAFHGAINEELLVAYRELLNESEKEEELRFYFAKDRYRYLVTRALVRTTLSRYTFVDPKDWIFSANPYGQPYIARPRAANCQLSFSISHTKGLIAMGVAKGQSLGVDVENFTPCDISIDIASHYFAPQEVAGLREVPHHEQQYRFFEYWTFKESYIKARSMGATLPLDGFSFHFDDDHAVDLAIKPELADDPLRWQLWQFRPTSEHLLAVCAEKPNAQSLNLLVREATPAFDERILAPELLRSSR